MLIVYRTLRFKMCVHNRIFNIMHYRDSRLTGPNVQTDLHNIPENAYHIMYKTNAEQSEQDSNRVPTYK